MRTYIEELFKQGNEMLNKSKYSEATECFEKVVEYGESEFLGGSYVNLAKCLNESSLENDEDNSKKIEEYLQKALIIKPTNQAAFANYFWYHLNNKRYAKAIEYILKVDIKQILDQGLFFLDQIHDYTNEQEADAFYSLFKRHTRHSRILVNVAMWHLNNGTPHKAYHYLKESLQIVGNDINVLSGLSMVCIVLNNPVEAEEYCKIGIKTLETKRNDVVVQNSMEGFYSNLALSYLNQQKYSDVVELLSDKVVRFPNNTDFHNLAFAHYMLGNIDEATLNCQKALYIAEDETSYYLMGECFFQGKDYASAIDWYKKALAFLNREHVTFHLEDRNLNIKSVLLDSKTTLKTIYINLVNALIQTEDYTSARAFQEMAKDKFPYDQDIKRSDSIIESIRSKSIEVEKVKSHVEFIEEELLKQHDVLKDRTDKVKEWALNLLKLQSRCVKDEVLIIKSESDWRVIENQMVSIADAMKSSYPSTALYQKIEGTITSDFLGLDQKSLTFFITAEYLFQVHKEASHIDYAPIMIEYCKVVENELNVILKQKKLIDKKNLTIGQLLYEMEHSRIKLLSEFMPTLRTILLYRNGSAHTGESTREKTEVMRGLLMNDGWLKYLLKQK